MALLIVAGLTLALFTQPRPEPEKPDPAQATTVADANVSIPLKPTSPADQEWIQTTASITGGNSGGPLLSSNGFVIGINTWGASDGASLGFAAHVKHLAAMIDPQQVTILPISNFVVEEEKQEIEDAASGLEDRIEREVELAEACGWAPQTLEDVIWIHRFAEGAWLSARSNSSVPKLESLRKLWTNSQWDVQRQIQPFNRFVAENPLSMRGVFGFGKVLMADLVTPPRYFIELLGQGTRLRVSDMSPTPTRLLAGQSCLTDSHEQG